MKIAIIYSNYYQKVADGLLEGVYDAAKDDECEFDEYPVLGSFEIPYMVDKISNLKEYDGFITLGCIIEGETYHNHMIADSVAKGLMDLSLSLHKPVGLGVLSVKTYEQAIERSSGDNNKGREVFYAIKSCKIET
jgi:6,7-dimethyl-8-ribityllumazine synthase